MATSADVVTVRMQSYLSLPLVQRCRELAILIDECSTTELQHVFPILIDSLFGLSNRVGWGLHSINLKHNPHEYETLCQFLGPQGPIFSLCYKLLPDCYLKYNFPVSYLPAKIRSMLEDGIIPPFYSDKIKDDQSSRISSALSMNPFEYYVFHFAYHLTNPWLQMQQAENVWRNWETAYVQLAHSYLYHFLPRDNSPVLPMIGPYVKKTPPRKLMQSPESKRLQTPRLLRTSILSPVSTTPQGVPQQQCLPQVWRSETVVQVFLDFWLEYTDDNQVSMHLNPSASGSLPRRQSIHSGEHIRLVRAFIKTLHEFANSARGDKSAMDELKRVILPSVQGKIYVFLRKAIHHWPLDSSFRLILEAWLSFIQPWRYMPDVGYTNEGKTEEEERGKIHDPARWMHFVANNLLAYTAIFQQLLPRFMRTDLVAPKNALMLFRVTKVFAQPHLAQMLSEAESCMDDTHLSRGKISTNQWSAIVRQQILEFEGPTYQYVPMFSTATLSQIVWFLSTIKQAHLTAASIVEALEKRRSERRFLLSVWEFFNGEDSTSNEIGLSERRRVPGFLASAQQQLIDIFQIRLDDIPLGIVVPDQEYHDSILSTSFCHQSHDSSLDASRNGVCVPRLQFRKGPDHEEHTYSRLDGTFSEMHGSKNCYYIKYKGDPELQPVRTNEFAFLVRKLYRISEYINTKYSREISSSYYREDFLGRVMRRILSPPTIVEELRKRTSNGFTKSTSREIPPRLSLRPLASHNFMVAMLVGAFTFWAIGYGTANFFIIAFTVWVLYVLIRATCEPWSSGFDVNIPGSNTSAIARTFRHRSLSEEDEKPEQIRRMFERSCDENFEHRLH